MAAVVLCGLWACAGPRDDPSRPARPVNGGPTESISPKPEARRRPAQASLRGRVVHQSDIQGEPDTPYALGRVLVLPFDRFESFQRDAGAPPTMRSLESVGFVVQRELFDRYAPVSSRLDQSGRFSFSLEPAHYVFCVCNLGSSHPDPASFPLVIYGCFDRVITSGEEQTVEVLYGEGGLKTRE